MTPHRLAVIALLATIPLSGCYLEQIQLANNFAKDVAVADVRDGDPHRQRLCVGYADIDPDIPGPETLIHRWVRAIDIATFGCNHAPAVTETVVPNPEPRVQPRLACIDLTGRSYEYRPVLGEAKCPRPS